MYSFEEVCDYVVESSTATSAHHRIWKRITSHMQVSGKILNQFTYFYCAKLCTGKWLHDPMLHNNHCKPLCLKCKVYISSE